MVLLTKDDRALLERTATDLEIVLGSIRGQIVTGDGTALETNLLQLDLIEDQIQGVLDAAAFRQKHGKAATC